MYTHPPLLLEVRHAISNLAGEKEQIDMTKHGLVLGQIAYYMKCQTIQVQKERNAILSSEPRGTSSCTIIIGWDKQTPSRRTYPVNDINHIHAAHTITYTYLESM
jgi:hypothetical protein